MKKKYAKPEVDYILFMSSENITSEDEDDIVDGSFGEVPNPWGP